MLKPNTTGLVSESGVYFDFGLIVYCGAILVEEVAPLICVRGHTLKIKESDQMSDVFFRLTFRVQRHDLEKSETENQLTFPMIIDLIQYRLATIFKAKLTQHSFFQNTIFRLLALLRT